jgi:pyruvate,orthophosphate dikinase
MFGNVVLDIPRSHFEDELDDIKYEKGLHEDSDLSADDLKELVGRFKNVYEQLNMRFPQDVWEQLKLSSTWCCLRESVKTIGFCSPSFS